MAKKQKAPVVKQEEEAEEVTPIRGMVNKIFPPRPESTETSIIRDLVAIVQKVAPDSNFSAVIRAEKYLAEKAK